MDWLIIALGVVLFTTQTMLAWRALRWRGTNFDEKSDRWLTNLAQAAEWFPLLGLLGTVAGILQTFSAISGPVEPARVIALYAPAITATGSGLFMALLNILPTWMVMFGRDVLLALGGGDAPTGDLPT
jgi:biopolymer transport protein ExbB/TolQ